MRRALRTDLDLHHLHRHPRTAFWQRIRWALAAAAVTGAYSLVLYRVRPSALDSVWWVGAVVSGVAVLVAIDNYLALRHRVTDRFLVARWGTWQRRTSVIEREAVLGWVFRQTWLQWRLGLVTVTASTAAGTGGYHVCAVGVDTGVELARNITPDLIADIERPARDEAGSAALDGAITRLPE